ncbi:ATP-binding protein (plasmid) [Thioclava litoralis]|uniref:histidine kinase n=1 Tax=Thioclava litoralis TaxID=3076557 RepID=A0ABZ1E707_9RHOB|nr:ATP-binding protein [Thioclava sp. FTW29]
MPIPQEATGERRRYNRWVANETIEDFALRFTARRARRWSMARVVNTALGSISFLALEAIGATLAVSWGFETTALAILVGGIIMMLTALPVSYYAARYGVDIDLLTRGAGFGYFGSTLTSLIYACFTFIFFALEAAILAMALELIFGLPLRLGYLISAVAVIPLVAYGFSKISSFQAITQPFWIILNLLPFGLLAFTGYDFHIWEGFSGTLQTGPDGSRTPDLLAFGAASGVVLSLIAQIGEQVDFLRFLPEPKSPKDRRRWWCAVVAGGPGWVVLGAAKMLAGAWLAIYVLRENIALVHLADPTELYHAAFAAVLPWPALALMTTGIFVALSQMKINVTNAYAGSIAWSNFFSRITHAHPGRLVWLIFNVSIALLLMELGVFGALAATLTFYAHVAVAWIGALFADLTINKPLGLSPKGIEFRRAYLHDINPVGTGAMLGAACLSLLAHNGIFGPDLAALSTFLAFFLAIALAPAIALATRGRYYLARPPEADIPHLRPHKHGEEGALVECAVCQYRFDAQDMAHCPAYHAPICSLCCSLNASCGDACKPDATLKAFWARTLLDHLPQSVRAVLHQRLTRFLLLTGLISGAIGGVLWVIRARSGGELLDPILGLILAVAIILTGIVVWLFILSAEARKAAIAESETQTEKLRREIRAHERTDQALQQAKEKAEAANLAKTRYMGGMSHELRTPLNAIYGYAQILEADPRLPAGRLDAVRAIRRSSEHLAGLIEGLLDISKIEAGRLELNRTRVHFPELLHQITEIFDETAREEGIAFEVVYETPLPNWIVVDEKRLRQVLINLLSNAFRYTEAGTVTLRLHWRNHVARIDVIDTGAGIAPEDLTRIWAPFERGRGVRRSGSGLGLTITQLLTDLMGGEISVKSTLGQGSTFQLRLYLPTASRTAGHIRTAPAPQTTLHPPRRADPDMLNTASYRGRRRRIMVVDDEADHLDLMQTYLGAQHFDILPARSAEEAQSALSDGQIPPDLFLLDIDLPGQSGWDLLRWLRSNGHHSTPAIMLSGHALEARSDSSERLLHDAFIAKPCILADLRDRIDDLLKLRRSATEADPQAPADMLALAPEMIIRLRDLALMGRLKPLRDLMGTLALPPALNRALRSALADADFERFTDELDAAFPRRNETSRDRHA